MGHIIKLGHSNEEDSTFLSREQKALNRLIILLESSLNCQAKALMTSTDSSLFKYFQNYGLPYQILKEAQMAIFPIFINKQQPLWGLLQVQTSTPLIKSQIDQILESIQKTLLPYLSPRPYTTKTQEKHHFLSHLHLFLSCKQHKDAIKIALDILECSHKSHLIYWKILKPKSIRDLCDLPEILIFIDEILCLSTKQRQLIALYLNLPSKLQGAQIVISSSCRYSELKSLICKETLLLNTLCKYQYYFSEAYTPCKKDKIIQDLGLMLSPLHKPLNSR